MPDCSASKPDVFAVRRGWLIILAFLVHLITILLVTDPSALAIKRAVLAITALMLLLGILPNLKWWAFRVFAVGFILNTLVMTVNGGLMPVTPENHQRVLKSEVQMPSLSQTPPNSKNVLLASADTKLSFLSDTIYLPVLKPRVYSIGDLFLVAGILVFVAELASRSIRRRFRH